MMSRSSFPLHHFFVSPRWPARVVVVRTMNSSVAADEARLPWWKKDRTFQDLKTEVLQLSWQWNHCTPRPISFKALEAFKRDCAVELVFLSCKLEQSVPSSLTREDVVGALEDTYNQCEQLHSHCFQPCSLPWPSDGSQDDLAANKNQMIQHMKALCFLCSHRYTSSHIEPLTPELLQKAHSILLNNATDDERNPLHAGVYRKHPAHSSSGLVFLEPAKISHAVEDALTKYSASENELLDSNQFFIERVARLYYELIMAHPFTDGNGRLFRLLIACLLMREGVPFPVPMHNGHKKNRQHYMGVTGHADAHCNTHRLQCYILDCLLFWWKRLHKDM